MEWKPGATRSHSMKNAAFTETCLPPNTFDSPCNLHFHMFLPALTPLLRYVE